MRVLVFVAVSACTGKVVPVDDTNEPVDDPDPEPTTTTTTTTTTTEPGFLEVTQMYIDAEFGWDAALQQLVDVDAGGGNIAPSTVYLLMGTDEWRDGGWDTSLTDRYCVIALPLTSSAPAAWATQDPTVWFGVDYTEGVAGALTNCGEPGKELDPAKFGEDFMATIIEDLGPWGVGLGEWGPSWYDEWLEYYPDDDLLERYVGARLQNGFDFDIDDFRAYPVEIDQDYVAQDDGTLYIGVPPEQIPAGDTVATAWYRVSSLWVYGI